MADYASAPNLTIGAGDGVSYAYRDVGAGDGPPLILLQHFRGNLDNWDPAVVDALAADRRVIAFDYAGVGGSTGRPADTIEQMGREALTFVTALGLDRIDLLGFSIGSFVAQEVLLARPDLIRRTILASVAPAGAPDNHGWAPGVIGAVGGRETSAEQYLSVFFTGSEASLSAGRQTLGRLYGRTDDRDTPTDWATRLAQYDAVLRWGVPDIAHLARLTAIRTPVLVAVGDSDPMIRPRFGHLVAGLLPDATFVSYPDAAHGFMSQHHKQFSDDVAGFLA